MTSRRPRASTRRAFSRVAGRGTSRASAVGCSTTTRACGRCASASRVSPTATSERVGSPPAVRARTCGTSMRSHEPRSSRSTTPSCCAGRLATVRSRGLIVDEAHELARRGRSRVLGGSAVRRAPGMGRAARWAAARGPRGCARPPGGRSPGGERGSRSSRASSRPTSRKSERESAPRPATIPSRCRVTTV